LAGGGFAGQRLTGARSQKGVVGGGGGGGGGFLGGVGGCGGGGVRGWWSPRPPDKVEPLQSSEGNVSGQKRRQIPAYVFMSRSTEERGIGGKLKILFEEYGPVRTHKQEKVPPREMNSKLPWRIHD